MDRTQRIERLKEDIRRNRERREERQKEEEKRAEVERAFEDIKATIVSLSEENKRLAQENKELKSRLAS